MNMSFCLKKDSVEHSLFLLRSSENFHEKFASLDQIAAYGNIYDLKNFADILFSENSELAKKVGSTIAAICSRHLKTKDAAMIGLYEVLSGLFYWDDCLSKKKQIQSLCELLSIEECIHIYGLFSCNRNGYLREFGLTQISSIVTKDSFLYVTRRLKDHVESIRSIAKSTFDLQLAVMRMKDFAVFFAVIEWMQRNCLDKYLDKIHHHIRLVYNKEEFVHIVQHAKPYITHFFMCVLRDVVLTDHMLVNILFANSAPIIMEWVIDHVKLSVFSEEKIIEIANHSATRVRYALLKKISAEKRCCQVSFLFDKNRYVRALARNLFPAQGYLDRYKTELERKESFGAIAGFCELATVEEVPLLLNYLNHPNAKVRAEIIYALDRLSVSDVSKIALAGIKDSSSLVRKISAKILQKNPAEYDFELEEMLVEGSFYQKRAAFNVLVKSPFLEALRVILLVFVSNDKELVDLAIRSLSRWERKYYARLWYPFTKETLDQVIQYYEQLKAMDFGSRFVYELKTIEEILNFLKRNS